MWLWLPYHQLHYEENPRSQHFLLSFLCYLQPTPWLNSAVQCSAFFLFGLFYHFDGNKRLIASWAQTLEYFTEPGNRAFTVITAAFMHHFDFWSSSLLCCVLSTNAPCPCYDSESPWALWASPPFQEFLGTSHQLSWALQFSKPTEWLLLLLVISPEASKGQGM